MIIQIQEQINDLSLIFESDPIVKTFIHLPCLPLK